MEFPAEAVTNLRITELYSTVHWRIYCIEPQLHSPTTEALDGSSSAFTSELDSSIVELRDCGCLVDIAPGGVGVWLFSHNGEFSNLEPFSTIETDPSLAVLQVGATTFRQAYSDFTPLGYLIKRLMTEPQSTIFSPLTQKNLATAKCQFPMSWEAVTASAFYRAFTSAIAGLLSLRATQMQGAIPLGMRTLFTMVDPVDEISENRSLHPLLGYTALLSTLNIELSFKTLIISWRTVPQYGLQQLFSDTDSSTINNMSRFDDIWLAPTGSLCRYIGPESTQPVDPSEHLSSGDSNNFEFSARGSFMHRREWKQFVYHWLQRLSLGSRNSKSEPWIEVEGLDETRKPAIVTRFLWPARLCFKRLRGCSRSTTLGVEKFDSTTLDPLQFAEKWFEEYETTISAEDTDVASGMKEAEELQPDVLPITERIVQPEMTLSLARSIIFPDLAASTFYPTPPGGVTGAAFPSITATDGSVLSGGSGLSQPQLQSEIGLTDIGQLNSAYPLAATTLSGVDITTPAIGIGSGMYDTTADDDLFDELDGNLEAKQVTEADFNFFDQPDSANFPDIVDFSQQSADDFETNSKSPKDTHLVISPSFTTAETSVGLTIECGTDHATNSQQPITNLQNAVSEDNSQLHSPNDDSKTNFQKLESPPPLLSPLEVKDILLRDVPGFPGPKTGVSSGCRVMKRRNKSEYEPVTFRKNLDISDEKYQKDGPFWFLFDAHDSKTDDRAEFRAPSIPTIGIPKWPVKEPEHNAGSNPDSSSEYSEDGEESGRIVLDRLNPDTPADLVTKEDTRIFKEYSLSPLERSTVTTEASIPSVDSSLLAFSRSLLFRGTEWSLDGYFPTVGNNLPALPLKESLIQIAQLAVDQVTQSSLLHNFYTSSGDQKVRSVNSLPLSISSDDSWHNEFTSFDLKRYTSIDDDTQTSSLRKDFRYVLAGSISKLDPPHIQIHRKKGYFDILPPAIPFWRPFGLEPTHGQKDIVAFCVHPHNAQEGADAFLDRLSLLYSSSNLGRHSRPSGSTGLVPWSSDSQGGQNYVTIMNGLQTTCEHLGDVISTIPSGGETIVVYIVNPFRDEAAIIDICTAFLCLFRKYVLYVDKHAVRPNEVALQIIPLDFIASSTSLVMPSQREYLNLAFEVYSRCPPKHSFSDLLGCAPPFTLAKSTPKFVPFKLASDPGSPLTERNFLHVAYSQSLDRRWVTAAWTDNIGREQVTLTYCLREKGSDISRPLSEIRADIWNVTLYIIGKSQSYWRVLLVKDEPVELEEAEAWVSLAQQHNQTKLTKIELTLLSVNIKPCIYFKLPSAPLQLTALTGPHTSTPVSTPNPGMPSPDPSATAPTPPPSSAEQIQTPTGQFLESTEPETVLVDKSDETWSVTLSHRLNISPCLTTYHPALASGYLVRRCDGSDIDGLASFGVNLLFTHARLPTEMLLKDVLRMYRDLTTLARTRGTIHAQGDAPLPWHISTAVNGREFLSSVL